MTESEEEREAAKRKVSTFSAQQAEASEDDSDFEQVLEHLDADAMQNDPDIKKEKLNMAKKKKMKKMHGLQQQAKKLLEARRAKKAPGQHKCIFS